MNFYFQQKASKQDGMFGERARLSIMGLGFRTWNKRILVVPGKLRDICSGEIVSYKMYKFGLQRTKWFFVARLTQSVTEVTDCYIVYVMMVDTKLA